MSETSRVVRPIAALLFFLLSSPFAFAEELPRAPAEDVGMSSPRLQRLSDTLQQYIDDGQLAGAVALVARRGKVVFLESFGERDRESGSPMSTDSIFRIASQTKALVSTAIMILQEEGRLLITDPVSKFLPSFAETTVAVPREEGDYDVVPATRPITLRHLLTHTSGVSYGSGPAAELWEAEAIQGWYFAHRDEPIAATVDRLAKLPFDAQPGERWIYGYSTDILGAVVEKASGQSLRDFLRQRVLEPLGMVDSDFYLPAAKVDRLATVYSTAEDGSLQRAPDHGRMVGQGAYVEGPRKSFSGGAGLLSTAEDYARFLQMTLDGGRLGDTRLLSPTSVKLMTVNHVGDKFGRPGTGFGLGFSVVTDVGARGVPGSVGEYGWGGAYHSTYWVDPEAELVVVYLTQLIPARGVDDQGKLRALVYAAIVD